MMTRTRTMIPLISIRNHDTDSDDGDNHNDEEGDKNVSGGTKRNNFMLRKEPSWPDWQEWSHVHMFTKC